METVNEKQGNPDISQHLSEKDIKIILQNCGYSNEEVILEDYELNNASDKMLGFLADYWKLRIMIREKKYRKTLFFFIKAVSRINASKAEMIKDLNLYQKELHFYLNIKRLLDMPGLKTWAAKFITSLNDALVFEDLSATKYKLRNKFERFDMAHTLQALRTLASFHASTIIFEDKRSKELQRPYQLIDEYSELLDSDGYSNTSTWYTQCKNAALEAVKTFSKYSKDNHTMKMIESRWDALYENTLRLADPSASERNVLCHRDLWNNNILFHYKQVDDGLEPDDCLLVDFQAARYQPLAGDVMLLFYCNLDPKYREENMSMFLNFYHQELRLILCSFGISIDNVMSKVKFLSSAEVHRQWGLIICSCLMPQFWVDDDLTTATFCDSTQFNEVLTKNKASFVMKLMHSNQDYKRNIMAILEEIVERYCI